MTPTPRSLPPTKSSPSSTRSSPETAGSGTTSRTGTRSSASRRSWAAIRKPSPPCIATSPSFSTLRKTNFPSPTRLSASWSRRGACSPTLRESRCTIKKSLSTRSLYRRRRRRSSSNPTRIATRFRQCTRTSFSTGAAARAASHLSSKTAAFLSHKFRYMQALRPTLLVAGRPKSRIIS